MRNRTVARHRRRAVAVVPTIALAAAGLAATSVSGAATAAPAEAPTGVSASSGYYINYAAPQIERAYANDTAVGSIAKGKVDVKDVVARAEKFDAKYAQGNPVTARELAKLEAKAIKTGQSPKRSRAGTRARSRPRRRSC